MKVSKVFKSVRYSLVGLNSIFLLSGLLLLIVGLVAFITYKSYEGLITPRFFQLPNFLIATAVIIFCVSALGFYSAVTEHFYFIVAYVVLLLAILIFEIAMCIVGYGLYNDTISEIRPTMTESLKLYGNRMEMTVMWDDLQRAFECCGVGSSVDWGGIPVSCCHIDYGTVSPFFCTREKAYSRGCAGLLATYLSYNAYVIGVTALVLTCLQALIVAGAGWLAWRSRYEEVDLES